MPDDIPAGPVQQAKASDRARVTQVGGNYAEHHHCQSPGFVEAFLCSQSLVQATGSCLADDPFELR
ncbi:hypothetical protein, partial [Kitasatospora sp. NPDC050543]|uniref:hypothetical protein n=1 Tax=Kitasatospora sp. NPDC050543 TaxID=3364054 RepID=UPI00378987AE